MASEGQPPGRPKLQVLAFSSAKLFWLSLVSASGLALALLSIVLNIHTLRANHPVPLKILTTGTVCAIPPNYAEVSRLPADTYSPYSFYFLGTSFVFTDSGPQSSVLILNNVSLILYFKDPTIASSQELRFFSIGAADSMSYSTLTDFRKQWATLPISSYDPRLQASVVQTVAPHDTVLINPVFELEDFRQKYLSNHASPGNWGSYLKSAMIEVQFEEVNSNGRKEHDKMFPLDSGEMEYILFGLPEPSCQNLVLTN